MAKWSGLGVNATQPSAYWYNYTESMGEPYVPLVVDNFDRVRIFSDFAYSTSITAVHTWALQLKAARPDIKILYGTTRSGLGASNQADYTSQVLAEAQWAMDNGMDELQISNECELHRESGITDAQVRTYLRSLATEAKSVFTRPISYAIPQGFEDGWISEGKGSLDKVSINVYGNNGALSSFETIAKKVYAAFGDDSFVSEWNVHHNWTSASVQGQKPTDPYFDEVYGAELLKRQEILRRIGYKEAYFFCLWAFSPDFGIDYFSLYKKDTGLVPAASQLLAERRRSAYIVRS